MLLLALTFGAGWIANDCLGNRSQGFGLLFERTGTTYRGSRPISTEEELRQITEEWQRMWSLDEEDENLEPQKVHGGVI
jgi:hypothetical protein